MPCPQRGQGVVPTLPWWLIPVLLLSFSVFLILHIPADHLCVKTHTVHLSACVQRTHRQAQ